MKDSGNDSTGYVKSADEEKVLEKERQLLGKSAGQPLLGLAISGGGIRSATFSLGVLQALARRGVLENFDYLSTVSGGGYIGSSLSWLLYENKLSRPDPETLPEDEDESRFDLSKECFPYGTTRRSLAGLAEESAAETLAAEGRAEETAEDTREKQVKFTDAGGFDKVALLRYLRQHGNYLLPGDGIGAASFFAVFIRGLFTKALVYFPILVGLFILLWSVFPLLRWETPISGLPASPEEVSPFNWITVTGLVLAAFMLFWSFLYAIGTFFLRWYPGRRIFEIVGGRFWQLAVIFVLVGTIPVTEAGLHNWWSAWACTSGGVLAGLWAFAKSAKGALKESIGEKKGVPMGLVVTLASVLLIYGLAMLAFKTAKVVDLANLDAFGWTWIVLLGVALLTGLLSNLNHLSIHRFYRDRLMETYMPAVDVVMKKKKSRPGLTEYANKAYLHHLAPREGKPAIYHLINTNLVLVGSDDAKYRGRGGDSFILSPLYCGSKATGWRKSDKFMGGEMNLPTAMAISGAAVNPSTGVGGEGPTRNPLLSFLLSLLNVRLGYWAPHPDPKRESIHNKPNFFRPGYYELVSKRIDEKHPFVQLSDGGHFENLGIYELIRRKCKLILVCDGAADSSFYFGDLGNATEKVRADFGAKVSVEVDQLAKLVPTEAKPFPKDTPLAQQGHCCGTVRYIGESEKADLIFLKTTLTDGLPADIYGYRSAHPEFPDQTTADQFFDEKQFEAYRELGYSLGVKLLADPEVRRILKKHGLMDASPDRGKPAAASAKPTAAGKAKTAAPAKAGTAADFTKIEGVGSKIRNILSEAGIGTFEDLARASVDELRDILEKAGARYRMHDPTTWPEQADLAARDKWDELAALQNELKGGRRD